MTDIVFLLDESLSMIEYSKSYINGINNIINTQKQFNPYSKFSLIKFNNEINTVCIDSIINTLPEFTSKYYNPDGLTKLYDAIGHIIDIKFTNELKQVIVIILTDGEDNYSNKYNLQSISEKILFVKSNGWEFVYIAANQNAQLVGHMLGIETCLTYNETVKSIDNIANACNIAIGHAMYKWSGIYNKYCEKRIPTDIIDLMKDLENFTI